MDGYSNIKQLDRQSVILQNLKDALVKKTSKNFFNIFTTEFSKHMNVFCLFIGVINLKAQTIRTLSFVLNHKLCENFEYEYSNYPCLQVITQKNLYSVENLKELYPKAFHFISPFFSNYLGIPVFSEQELLGIIVFLSNHKTQIEDCTEMIPHFSQRIGSEMKEHIQMNIQNEKQITLESINSELKANLDKQNLVLEKTSLLLSNARTHLIEQDKMATLGLLSAGIAHEINNPLNYVSVSLEGLRVILLENLEVFQKLESKLQNFPELLEYWETEIQAKVEESKQDFEILDKNIKVGLKKIADLVKSLRTYAHAEENFQSANLHEIIQSAVNILQYEIKNKVTLELDFEPRIPNIICIPNKLTQVFINLIQNAIQARKENEIGKIKIQTSLVNSEQENSTVRIEISDEGIGISGENVEKIFQPFFTTKPIGEGVGLGLFITYGIIEKHKGKITVESEKQKGTRFIIELPIK